MDMELVNFSVDKTIVSKEPDPGMSHMREGRWCDRERELD